jgi:hypothetical protein
VDSILVLLGKYLKTFVWMWRCCYLYLSEKPFNDAGEVFEDIYVDEDICTLLQQRWEGVLGY